VTPRQFRDKNVIFLNSLGASNSVASSGTGNRWTFIQGYEAMQKHLASWNKSTSTRCYSRKLQKRLMHHSQQLKELEAAKKAYQSSTQALSALSTQAATLSSKLEAALKAQEQFLKKTVQQHTLKVCKKMAFCFDF
jgi:baculoviral IAP repeat-containing protein 6 (apollon)